MSINFVFFQYIFFILENKSKKKKKNLILSSDDKIKNLIDVLGITNPKIIDVTKKTGKNKFLLNFNT